MNLINPPDGIWVGGGVSFSVGFCFSSFVGSFLNPCFPFPTLFLFFAVSPSDKTFLYSSSSEVENRVPFCIESLNHERCQTLAESNDASSSCDSSSPRRISMTMAADL